jgi:hypothetical protein
MVMTASARPGGTTPEHLWLADDEDKLVVSVLAPEVAGDARHDIPPGRLPSSALTR